MADDFKRRNTVALSAVWERYQFYSGKASDTVRTSAIAGLAASWLFSGTNKNGLTRIETAPHGLLFAGALFALALGLDILQYFAGALAFQRAAVQFEREGKKHDEPVGLSPRISLAPTIFYFAKIAVLAIGYAVLAVRLFVAIG